jgi:hypothetical protein
MVLVPALMPVTAPLPVMVATVVLPLLQVPLDMVVFRVVLAPAQIADWPVRTGFGLTVTR